MEGIDLGPFVGKLFARDEEMNLLGDVGAMVADPFQVLGDE
jgi:hypothetical protein